MYIFIEKSSEIDLVLLFKAPMDKTKQKHVINTKT